MNWIDRILPSADRREFASHADWFQDFLTGGKTKSGVSVNTKTALSLPAVYSGISLWGGLVASLPIDLFVRSDGGKNPERNHTVSRLLRQRPNKYMNGYEFRRLMIINAILHGNSYSVIEYDQQARPVTLTPIPPTRMTPLIDDDTGDLTYVMTGQDGGGTIFDPVNVLHIKSWGSDGITGKSFVDCLKTSIGLSIAAQDTGANFFANGMKLDAVIEIPGQLSEDGLKRLRNSFKKYVNGERVIPLDSGMKLQQMSMKNSDAQFLESRKFGVTDIARALRIPPPLLYDLEKATYSNISELMLSYVKFDMMPWLVNIEAEMNDKLLTTREKDIMLIEHNVDGLLRGTPAERADLYRALFNVGAIAPNEIRSKENMNPYAAGNAKWVQTNMMKNE